MTQTITALTLQKRNTARVNVFLDGAYAFSLSVDGSVGLTRGQHLSPADVERLQSEDEGSRAYHHALRLLGYRQRSQVEVARHLRQKGYTAPAIDAAIARLLAHHYLDDAEFARAWVEHRERSRPRGARALRYELRQKGVDASSIDSAVAALDEDASAWVAVESKLERWRGLGRSEFDKKVMGFLSRRGFGYSTIRTVCRKSWEAVSPSDP